jgi:hypothetical protein
MAQRDAARPIDPPLTTISANDVMTAVATRMRTQLPPGSTTQQSVPTAALEALVQEVADAALVTMTAGWARVVSHETARREAAAAHNEQQRDVGAKWNHRSRVVAVLGAPGMGYGENVLPYLRRSVEGVALHATSRELRKACRRRRWPPEVCEGMVLENISLLTSPPIDSIYHFSMFCLMFVCKNFFEFLTPGAIRKSMAFHNRIYIFLFSCAEFKSS